MQIAVAGLGAAAVRLVEERRRPRALARLPDRLRAVKAGLALELGVQAGRRQGRREGRLRLLVAVVVEVDHSPRDQLGRGARPNHRRLGRGKRRRNLFQPVAGALAPGLERRLRPDPPVKVDHLLPDLLPVLAGPRLLRRLGLLVEDLGVAGATGEPRQVALEGRQRLVPAIERAQRIDADQIGLGLGDAPLRHLAGPLDRAGVVAAPQPAAGGVVGVVRRQLRVAVVELLEQLARVGPVGLVGPRQRQQVGRRQPLVPVARQRLQRAREARLGAAPVVAAELLGGRLGGAVLEERLQPVAVERDRFPGVRGGRRGRRVGLLVAADRLRERRSRQGRLNKSHDEGERERRRDRRAASDGHSNRLRTTRATCKKEGQLIALEPAGPRVMLEPAGAPSGLRGTAGVMAKMTARRQAWWIVTRLRPPCFDW